MRHTDQHVEITMRSGRGKPQSFTVSPKIGKQVRALLKQQQAAVAVHRESEKKEEDEWIPLEVAFPDLFDPVKGPAISLRGLRYRENLTQKQLAEKAGIRQHHLSEMEHGKRPIGKEMAKKLAVILRANWKVFV